MFSCQEEMSSKVLVLAIARRKELTCLVLCDRVVGWGWGELRDSKVCT